MTYAGYYLDHRKNSTRFFFLFFLHRFVMCSVCVCVCVCDPFFSLTISFLLSTPHFICFLFLFCQLHYFVYFILYFSVQLIFCLIYLLKYFQLSFLWIHSNSSPRAEYDTRSIFKRETAGLNSKFFLTFDWLPGHNWRNQSASFIYIWRQEKRWIHAFHKDISEN